MGSCQEDVDLILAKIKERRLKSGRKDSDCCFGWFFFLDVRWGLLGFTLCIQSVVQIYNWPFPQKDTIAEDEDAFDEETEESESTDDDDDDDDDENGEGTKQKPEKNGQPAGSSDKLDKKPTTEKTSPVPTARGPDSSLATSTNGKVTKKAEDTGDMSVISSPSSGSYPSTLNILMSWIWKFCEGWLCVAI